METPDARQFYEAKLGRKLPDDVWAAGDEERSLEDGYRGKAAYDDWSDVVEDNLTSLRRLLNLYEKNPQITSHGRISPRRKSDDPTTLRYTEQDRQTLFTLATVFAAEASRRSDVKSFRESVIDEAVQTTTQYNRKLAWLTGLRAKALGNPADFDVEQIDQEILRMQADMPKDPPQVVSDEVARKFVGSPLTQCLSLEQFREHRISPMRHVIRSSQSSTVSGRHPLRILALENPDVTIRLEEDFKDGIYRVTVQREADSETHGDATNLTPNERLVEAYEVHLLAYPLQKGGEGTVDVWQGSLLHSLSKLASELARCYHWTKAGAAWFVLTGQTPMVQGLDISVYGNTAEDAVDAYIEIRMLPWLHPKTIQGAIRSIRADLAHAGRKVSSRNLKLVNYIVSRVPSDISPKDKRWKELHRQWNDSHGKMEGFRNADDLRAAYNSDRDSLRGNRNR